MKTKLNLLTTATFLAASVAAFSQPNITTQPQSCTNVVGTTATFWVEATGTPDPAHQWQKLAGTWTDLSGCTDTNLCLTNVQTSHAGDYRVVITNAEGSVTSDVAHLTVVSPPTAFIQSLAPYQRMAVYRGSNTSLKITASGTPPLSHQWRLDGLDLPGETNQTYSIPAAQPEDEGNYTAVVTDLYGSITSAPAYLYVTPPSAQFVRCDFTNASNLRLPYWYLLPESYDPSLTYPLVCVLHGNPGGETYFQTYADIGPQGIGAVYGSYRRQLADPAVVVWPARRAADTSEWTAQYLQQILELLDHFTAEFHGDTNRIYIVGMSEGVHAVWDCLGSRPGFFAGATVLAGRPGISSAASIADVPLWVFCARDDNVGNSRTMVRLLRQSGGKPVYTEYNSGGHMNGIAMGLCTPAAVNWMLAQRRTQASTNEPLLAITNPVATAAYSTAGAVVNLAGCAEALGQAVTSVSWTNFANNAKGVASGTNIWSVTNIPLVANKTNVVVVVGTTTSWTPPYGGNTTFNETLTVIQSPILATLVLQGTEAILDWTCGGPPYRVQRATDLMAGDWTDYLTDAAPPVPLPLTGQVGFYRILGQ